MPRLHPPTCKQVKDGLADLGFEARPPRRDIAREVGEDNRQRAVDRNRRLPESAFQQRPDSITTRQAGMSTR